MSDGAEGLPYLSADLPGTGGRIKTGPEDFVVDEIPLYEPCGEGTHLYLFIEKQGISTFEALQRLAKSLGRPSRAFGVAGLKDAAATTRQYISIEHVGIDDAKNLDIEGIQVLEAAYHRNKLKRGHLKGNRFEVVIREPEADAQPKARAVLERLARRGVPNYFGPQRFGILNNTHRLGRALLQGEWREFADVLVATPRGQIEPSYDAVISHYRAARFEQAYDALKHSFRYEKRVLGVLHKTGGDFKRAALSLDDRILELYFSAFQSDLFNRLLAWRIDGIDRLLEGDAAFIHRNGACFLVTDVAAEAPRAARFEISPSGPLFGHKLLQTRGIPGQMEDEVLVSAGLSLGDFQKKIRRLSLRGARRPLRVTMESVDLTRDRDGSLRIAFVLPPGCYATVVLREIVKSGRSCDDAREKSRLDR